MHESGICESLVVMKCNSTYCMCIHVCGQDGDGTIGREEWRRWMAEKQQLIEMFNKEKEKLVKVIQIVFVF